MNQLLFKLENNFYDTNKERYINKTILSLFSGCGGMDIGFEGGFIALKRSVDLNLHRDWIEEDFGDFVKLKKTGFKTVFANDIKPEAKSAWVSYFKNSNDLYHLGSIVNLVERAKNGEDIFPKNISILTGGFPCQDFSVAGKRLGFNSIKGHDNSNDQIQKENRGNLYLYFKEVLELTKPLLFVAENVKGLTTLGDCKDKIEKEFSSALNNDYLVLTKLLNSADYGVPQSRERIIFLGFKKSALNNDSIKALTNKIMSEEYDPYPQPTHAYTENNNNLSPFVNCKEAFCGLVEPNLATDESQKRYSKAKFMGRHCQGQTEIKLDSVAPTIRSEHHGNIEFRRLSKEHGGVNFLELEKGLPERRLTIRECARLQTFPDDYQFILPKIGENVAVSASSAYKIIGNAVPCLLAYNIAMRIKQNWNKYFGYSCSNNGESKTDGM